MNTLSSLPIDDGFRMPAEFEFHKSTWMAWPYRLDTWHHDAKDAQSAYAQVANAIAEFEKVIVCVKPGYINSAEKLLSPNITLLEMDYDSEWMRDIGPTFLVNDRGVVRGIDWEFNSWGGLLNEYKFDNLLAGRILEYKNIDRYKLGLILEGGAIHVDGQGTMITTEECLLNNNRNNTLSKRDYEKLFRQYLSVTKIIWLKKGIYQDIVNGHIDNLCSFISPGLIILNWTDDINDPQYEISQSAYEILSAEKDAKGDSFIIVKIHQPSPLFVTDNECKVVGEFIYKPGDRLGASYINSYLVNGGVIIPSFNDKYYDEKAYGIYVNLFPKRKICQIFAREIIIGGGGIHCITQQQPVSLK
jgi:agmatine deiminase